MINHSNPRKILIVRLSALGDVIQTLPVISLIRQCQPDAEIGWLVEADAAALLADHPLIDHLHVSQRKKWLGDLKNPLKWLRTLRAMIAFFQSIHTIGYDTGIDCQGLLKSALSLYWGHVPHRIGYSNAREGASLFYTQKLPAYNEFDPNVPLVRYFYPLIEALGYTCHDKTPEYPLPPTSPLKDSSVGQCIPNNTPMIVIAPGTQWQSKQWPTHYWQELLQSLEKTTQASLVLIGGNADKALCDALAQTSPNILNLAGQTSLPELQSLLSNAAIVIGSDSAPLHLAGALNKPRLIGLYGPTSLHRTPPPYQANGTLLTASEQLACQPCHEKTCPLGTTECLNVITPSDVLSVVQQDLHDILAAQTTT